METKKKANKYILPGGQHITNAKEIKSKAIQAGHSLIKKKQFSKKYFYTF